MCEPVKCSCLTFLNNNNNVIPKKIHMGNEYVIPKKINMGNEYVSLVGLTRQNCDTVPLKTGSVELT